MKVIYFRDTRLNKGTITIPPARLWQTTKVSIRPVGSLGILCEGDRRQNLGNAISFWVLMYAASISLMPSLDLDTFVVTA
jgi:hypothetical protein